MEKILHKGREELLTDLLPNDVYREVVGARPLSAENLKKDLEIQLPKFRRNAAESRFLLNYIKGEQPILEREIAERAIDNKVVVNYAYAISRNLSSYAYSTGIQYVATDTKWADDVKKINDLMILANKAAVVQEMKYLQSICGRTFISIEKNKVDPYNGCPFVVQSLSPLSAFTVNSVFDRNTCVYGGVEYEYDTPEGHKKMLQVYTVDSWFVFDTSDNIQVIDAGVHTYGEVPIIEVKNNTFMLGDFEVAISLIDAINSFTTDWTTNVQEIVTSYLCLFGVDPDSIDIEAMKANRILAFPNPSGANQSAQFIYAQLDGTSMDMLKSYLNEALKLITGMPDRDSSNANTSGVAEDIKTGQNDREAIAVEKTTYTEVAEKRLLRILFNIIKEDYLSSDIEVYDIDVDITRINRDNILTKTQAMLNMQQLGMSNDDIVYFGNITNDVQGVAGRMSKNQEKMNEQPESGTETAAGSDSGDREDSENGTGGTSESN